MKKAVILLLAVAMLCAAAGCGDHAQEVSSTPDVESSLSTTTSESTTTTTTTVESTTTTASTTVTTTATKSTTTTRPTTTTTTEYEEGYTEEIIDDFVTTTTTKSKEQFLSQIKITQVGSPDDEKSWVYQLGLGGLMVREATIDSGRGGEAVEIVQVTDIHFNYVNEQDKKENNPSVMSTFAQRTHMQYGTSRPKAELCMRYGGFFDQVVVTGDTIDYLTWGAIEMLNEIIWDPYPNTLVALGNHDSVRVMGLKDDVADPTTLESRYEILQKKWKHDIYYTSKVVKNKAMVIVMDNSQQKFWDVQVPKLKADIEKARKKGYVVLVFVHEPLSTDNPEETSVYEIARMPKTRYNFYTNGIGGKTSSGTTREVWDLIMNNADVIRGVFAGHMHEDYYTEMLAKTPSGEDKIIPQYVTYGAYADNGHVLKITVK